MRRVPTSWQTSFYYKHRLRGGGVRSPITCVDCAFSNLYDLPEQDTCIIITRICSAKYEPCVHTALLDHFGLERQGKYSRSIDVWGPPSQSSAFPSEKLREVSLNPRNS